MIVTIALVSILNGNVYDLETYQTDYNPKAVHQTLQECQKKERMLKQCLLRVQRTEEKVTYVNLQSWYQFNAYKQ